MSLMLYVTSQWNVDCLLAGKFRIASVCVLLLPFLEGEAGKRKGNTKSISGLDFYFQRRIGFSIIINRDILVQLYGLGFSHYR